MVGTMTRTLNLPSNGPHGFHASIRTEPMDRDRVKVNGSRSLADCPGAKRAPDSAGDRNGTFFTSHGGRTTITIGSREAQHENQPSTYDEPQPPVRRCRR